MISFNQFISEASDKNTHLTHIEDSVLYGGIEGTRQAITALRSLRDMLAGKSDQKVGVTVKWDGCVHPDTILFTNKGEVTISELIQSTDITAVLAKDLCTGEDLMVPLYGKNQSIGEKNWVKIQLANNSELIVTEDHEIHTKNRGWVKAIDLTTEDDITEKLDGNHLK